jgi:hypothetical protein
VALLGEDSRPLIGDPVSRYEGKGKFRELRRHRVQWFAIPPILCKQLFLWVSMWVTHYAYTNNDYDLKAVDKEYFDGMGLLS